MNEQFDLQDFLFTLKDYTPENNRRRLCTILQQELNDDLTLESTLLVFETLFNEKKIHEQDFDSFIQTLRKMNCHHAAKRLEEYKRNRKTKRNMQIDTSSNVLSTKKNSRDASRSSSLQSFMKKIGQLSITKCDIILIVLNICIISAYLVIFIINRNHNKSSAEILVLKKGSIHGETGGGIGVFSDSREADLDFNQKITHIEGINVKDLNGVPFLGCITFTYSNRKKGYRHGCVGDVGPLNELKTVRLESGERITQVTSYEADQPVLNIWRTTNTTPLIVGLVFQTNYGRKLDFGANHGRNKTETYKDYFVGFVYGKWGGYIDCLRFVWYKYSSRNDTIFE